MIDNMTPQAETDLQATEKGKLSTLNKGQIFTRETLQSAGILIYLQNVKATPVFQGYFSILKTGSWLRQACSKEGINRLIQNSKSQQLSSCSLLCQRPDLTPQLGDPAPKLMQSHSAITYGVFTLPTTKKPIDHACPQPKSPLEGQINH